MRKKFIPFREFGNIYGQTQLNSLYVMRCKNEIPTVAFALDKKTNLVDVNFFVRRKKFQTKVWLEAHDNYFFLTRHMSASFLSKLIFEIDDTHTIDSWNMFFHKTLFRSMKENILAYMIDGMLMKFYRYSRWLIRGLFILANVKPQHRDTSVLLDRY